MQSWVLGSQLVRRDVSLGCIFVSQHKSKDLQQQELLSYPDMGTG